MEPRSAVEYSNMMTMAMNSKIGFILCSVSLLYEFVPLPPSRLSSTVILGYLSLENFQISRTSRNSIIASLYSAGIDPEVCSKIDQAPRNRNHGP
jgi:hypothetical protein